MPFDAGLLCQLSKELNEKCHLARVEKIHQPERDEVLLLLRLPAGNARLLLSANANYPRIHLTDSVKENPAVPPMFCMLLRKHLTGAVIKNVVQISFERVVRIEFQASNEIGDVSVKSLVLEVLGRQSNILLLDEGDRIIDSLKKIDISEKATRQIIPGVHYELPDSRNKLSPVTDMDQILSFVATEGALLPLEKSMMAVAMGFSPLIAREIAYRVSGDLDKSYSDLSAMQRAGLSSELKKLSKLYVLGAATPFLLVDQDGKVKDFTYVEISQYGPSYQNRIEQSFSLLLETFYSEKDRAESQNQKASQLKRVLTSATDRLEKKIQIQRQELSECSQREQYRIYGELLTAHLATVPPGSASVMLPNYYDENAAELKIPLNVTKSALQNAQGYFKKYQKLKTAERVLTEQIKKNGEELIYVESVLESLRHASTVKDFDEIREELYTSGYLRNKQVKKGKGKGAPKPSEPAKYTSSDGYTILVGKNNVQNDYLTFKIALRSDIWLHTLNIPGSHVIVKAMGELVSDRAISEAAQLAAFFSKASASSKVPVTYTEVRHVKKPNGAKPGFVIFTDYQTTFVTPEEIAKKS